MAGNVPSKKQTLLQYLERGVAMIHLDARRPGVVVPARYLEEAHLRLNVSYRYAIPDLTINEERVQATLSFGGTPFCCQLPWSAIFGITSHSSGDGQVWPEDLPTEVMQTLASRQEHERRAHGPPAEAPSPGNRRPGLVAVDGDREAAPQPGDPDPQSEAEPLSDAPAQKSESPQRHLRLVR